MSDIDAELEAQRAADEAFVAEQAQEPAAEAQPEPQPQEPVQEPRSDDAIAGLRNDLIKTRDRARRAETANQQLTERLAKLEGAYEALGRQQQPQPPAPAGPKYTFEEKPAEYLKEATDTILRRLDGNEKTLQEKVAAYEADIQRSEQQRQQEAYVAQLDNRYRTDWYSAPQEAVQARAFFVQQYMAEQQALGVPAMQADMNLALEERRLAYHAYSNEVSPVDLIVARSRARGFRPTAAVQSQPAAPAPVAQAAPAAAQQSVDAAKRAAAQRAAAGGIGGVPGSASAAPSIAELGRMSQREFDRLMREKPDAFREAMGG